MESQPKANKRQGLDCEQVYTSKKELSDLYCRDDVYPTFQMWIYVVSYCEMSISNVSYEGLLTHGHMLIGLNSPSTSFDRKRSHDLRTMDSNFFRHQAAPVVGKAKDIG